MAEMTSKRKGNPLAPKSETVIKETGQGQEDMRRWIQEDLNLNKKKSLNNYMANGCRMEQWHLCLLESRRCRLLCSPFISGFRHVGWAALPVVLVMQANLVAMRDKLFIWFVVWFFFEWDFSWFIQNMYLLIYLFISSVFNLSNVTMNGSHWRYH